MSTRPILFSGEMVRSIREGRKTQTRRVVVARGRDLRPAQLQDGRQWLTDHSRNPLGLLIQSRYGYPGDRLWVRETWAADFYWPRLGGGVRKTWDEMPASFRGPKADPFVAFKADCAVWGFDTEGRFVGPCGEADIRDYGRWHPSIHMPRWASRITLEITDVRVERLQAITANDCIAEGVPSRGIDRDGPCIASALMYIDDFQKLWDSINAKRGFGWDANPWVWVIGFRVLAGDESAGNDTASVTETEAAR